MLRNNLLEGHPGLLCPSVDVCQLPFFPGIFLGFLTRNELSSPPKTFFWDRQLNVLGSWALRLWNISTWYAVVWQKQWKGSMHQSVWSLLQEEHIPSGISELQETRREAVLDRPNSHFRRGLHLGQWTWLVLIFHWGRVFLKTSRLPFRFKEGEDTKAESSFDSLYTIQSYTSGSETISHMIPHTGFTRQIQPPGTISSVVCVWYKWVP